MVLWFNVFTDITEIKQSKNQLKQLNDAIEIIPNMLMLWDKENHLIMANKKARKFSNGMSYSKKNGI